MWSLLVITCIIFQTAVAIFLLNGLQRNTDIDKQLRAMLCLLLVHLSTKFLLLGVLKDSFLYTYIPTGFGLAYGPLLLVMARGVLGRPMHRQGIVLNFLPFLLFSVLYLSLVIGGSRGSIARSAIIGYTSWYEWLVLASLIGYPIYVRLQLAPARGQQARLVGQMANVLLIGISAGILLFALRGTAVNIPGFDLRLLPYICFAAIPVLILRYRLQENGAGDSLRKTIQPMEAAVPRNVPEAGAPVLLAAAVAEPAIVKAAEQEVGMIPTPDRRYEKSGLDTSRMDEYEAALAAFMRKSRIYLESDLSLELLASRMKMSRHHLTQLLNERIQKNFYNFINEYRIGEAIERLSDPALQVNILSLAFDCGFNSRSSFNSYFKKITGHTPSAYRKVQLESRHTVATSRRTRKPARLIRDTSPSA